MFEHRDPSGNKFRTYRVTAGGFNLDEGQIVQPGTEIGIDLNSGISLRSDYWGRVATIYYNPMNHSLLVMVSQKSCLEIEKVLVSI